MGILTFKQWDAVKRADIAQRYGVPKAELNRIYPPRHYYKEWTEYALKAYESGEAFTTRQWNLLTEDMQWKVLRTHRALSMTGHVSEPWKMTA